MRARVEVYVRPQRIRGSLQAYQWAYDYHRCI